MERIEACVQTVSTAVSEQVKSSSTSLDALSQSFMDMLSFKTEYEEMSLDEVIVAAIAQIVSTRHMPKKKC